MTKETRTLIIPSNPEDRKKLQATVADISNLITMAKAASDTVKEAVKGAAESHEMEAADIKWMAKTYNSRDFSLKQQKGEDLCTLYEVIMEGKLAD